MNLPTVCIFKCAVVISRLRVNGSCQRYKKLTIIYDTSIKRYRFHFGSFKPHFIVLSVVCLSFRRRRALPFQYRFLLNTLLVTSNNIDSSLIQVADGSGRVICEISQVWAFLDPVSSTELYYQSTSFMVYSINSAFLTGSCMTLDWLATSQQHCLGPGSKQA